MSGVLYIVATPIGNLEDITYRAIRILGEVDFIAAEDTRVTRKLLNHFSLKKELVSYYKQKERTAGGLIAARLIAGESCALVSDAGTPCISDPGNELVSICVQNHIPVVPVPGPCAAITALSATNLGGRFCFEGFLSTAKKSRREHLEQLVSERRTMVFYEAPHKLLATLEDLLQTLGDRTLVIGRELTKFYEEIRHTTLSEAVDFYRLQPPKGEYVLLVAGMCAEEKPDSELSLQEAVVLVREKISQGKTMTEAVKEIARGYALDRRELYQQVVQAAKTDQ